MVECSGLFRGLENMSQILSSLLPKSLTMYKLDRHLFQKSYAGVLYSSVTQLNRAPFFAVRRVTLVVGPAWNKVVCGDYDRWIKVYGNTRVGSEDLDRPHDLSQDASAQVYAADTGKHRIVELRLEGKHPSEVVCQSEDLNPTVDYEIRAEFCNKVGTFLKQRITVDGATVFDDFAVPAGLMELDWAQLPKELHSNG